jgi:uncharacterized protein DUF5906
MKHIVDRVNNFIKDNLCSGNDLHAKWVIRYLANIANATPNTFNLAFIGEKGCGKSSLLEWFARDVIGRRNVWCPTTVENLLEKYSGDSMKGKVMIFIDELETSTVCQCKKLDQFLKNLATSKTITIRSMRQDPYEIRNTMSFTCCSNRSPIRITAETRRWLQPNVSNAHKVVNGSHAEKLNVEYWNDIHTNLLNLNNGKVYFKYLVSIGKDAETIINKSPPITETMKDEMTKQPLNNVQR